MLLGVITIAGIIMVALLINAFIAMACTKKIDKYWVQHPEWESSFMYFQLNRFMKYGYYVLTKKPVLIEPPKHVKLWVSISLVLNAIIIIPLAVYGTYIKLTQ